MSKINQANTRFPKDEKWNIITHFIGIVFALTCFPSLLTGIENTSDYHQFIACWIYFVSFLSLYISSTTYHWISNPSRKKTWRKIDHISIYFMISGTYVPFMMEYIEFSKAIIFLSVMYFLVFVGSVLKLFFTGRYEKASLVLYVFLGWMIIFMGRSFYTNASLTVLLLLLLGGIAYTGGIYFYTRDDRKHFHAIWHIFVLLGSILHFLAVYNIQAS